jgi:predicted DCC family thiol-disulfide oxidoreductase YuxK
VQFVDSTGAVFAGAHAVVRLLAAAGSRTPLAAYERLPLVRTLCDLAYRFVAEHRPFFWRLTLWLQRIGLMEQSNCQGLRP